MNVQLTQPNDRSFRVEREFDAPREHVWRAMTDPVLIAKWWGRGNPLEVERLELRPGGHYRFIEHAPEGTFAFGGRIQDIQEPDVLEQTFGWDGMTGQPSIDSIRLMPLPGNRTKLVSTTVFDSRQERDEMLAQGCEDGMNQSYAALDRVLEQLAETRPPRSSITGGIGLTR
jgi:uncharacterized protein YndB with AHSA1/START domain